jgi:hypothetical protein
MSPRLSTHEAGAAISGLGSIRVTAMEDTELVLVDAARMTAVRDCRPGESSARNGARHRKPVRFKSARNDE